MSELDKLKDLCTKLSGLLADERADDAQGLSALLWVAACGAVGIGVDADAFAQMARIAHADMILAGAPRPGRAMKNRGDVFERAKKLVEMSMREMPPDELTATAHVMAGALMVAIGSDCSKERWLESCASIYDAAVTGRRSHIASAREKGEGGS